MLKKELEAKLKASETLVDKLSKKIAKLEMSSDTKSTLASTVTRLTKENNQLKVDLKTRSNELSIQSKNLKASRNRLKESRISATDNLSQAYKATAAAREDAKDLGFKVNQMTKNIYGYVELPWHDRIFLNKKSKIKLLMDVSDS